MRTRDRMYCQMIRSDRDISRDDRVRIATCSLRTPTDRQTDIQTERLVDNYSMYRLFAQLFQRLIEQFVFKM